MKTIVELYKKYRELVWYVICGGMTTLVNIVSYGVCADILGIHYLVSNFIAWVLSVLFAYVSNRTLVFKSKKRGASAIFREFTLFVSGRLMSMAGDMIIMFLCVSVAMLPGIVAKILSNIFVMIFNYVFSKLIIFRKR
ncbi:putative flippase GtrA [Catenibacillus scindens]|uniref:Putative flippase GtrA n=1 Tax=Catenibacillus scindens TaxID=673271 RepID=A0A7W8M3M5_9FIRM|nr:GtrA family protein [Catenibacillus scindens]MBB5262944.1 putative flippase GtrA [Catenibacillus scindens]